MSASLRQLTDEELDARWSAVDGALRTAAQMGGDAPAPLLAEHEALAAERARRGLDAPRPANPYAR